MTSSQYSSTEKGTWKKVKALCSQGVTRSDKDKLHKERFSLSMGNEHFTVRTMNAWNNLPRNVAEFVSLGIFKMMLYGVVDDHT